MYCRSKWWNLLKQWDTLRLPETDSHWAHLIQIRDTHQPPAKAIWHITYMQEALTPVTAIRRGAERWREGESVGGNDSFCPVSQKTENKRLSFSVSVWPSQVSVRGLWERRERGVAALSRHHTFARMCMKCHTIDSAWHVFEWLFLRETYSMRK